MRSKLNFTSAAVKRRAVLKFDVGTQMEAPGQVIEPLPGGREARQVGAIGPAPHETVEQRPDHAAGRMIDVEQMRIEARHIADGSDDDRPIAM